MKLKSLLLSVLFAVALAIPAGNAQAFKVIEILDGGTNNVAASTTDTSGIVGGGVQVTKQDYVGLLIKQTPYATNVQANVVYTFAKGIDATDVETTGSVTVTIPTSTNATEQVVFTSATVTGAGYLKLLSIANAADVAITNITIRAVQKYPAMTWQYR